METHTVMLWVGVVGMIVVFICGIYRAHKAQKGRE